MTQIIHIHFVKSCWHPAPMKWPFKLSGKSARFVHSLKRKLNIYAFMHLASHDVFIEEYTWDPIEQSKTRCRRALYKNPNTKSKNRYGCSVAPPPSIFARERTTTDASYAFLEILRSSDSL